SGNGVFTNAGGIQFLPAALGIPTNASLVGMLFDRNTSNFGVSAAVAGIDSTSSGNSESWGGYFNSLKVTGKVELTDIDISGAIHNNVTIFQNSDYYIKDDDYVISCYNTSNRRLYMPPS